MMMMVMVVLVGAQMGEASMHMSQQRVCAPLAAQRTDGPPEGLNSGQQLRAS